MCVERMGVQAGSLDENTLTIHDALLELICGGEITDNSFQIYEKLKIKNTFNTISVDKSPSDLAINCVLFS